MITHEELTRKMLQNPSVQAEYARLEHEEMPMLDALLQARASAGLTQAEVASRMGTKPPAVARLENALVTGKPSPSLATLTRYARALGKQLEVRFV